MIPTAIVALWISLAPQPTPDPWFAEDKLKHFFTSFVVTSFSASAARVAGVEPRVSRYLGAAAGATAGVYKELQDRRAGSRFSIPDLVWDAGGIASAELLLSSTR